MNTLPLIQTLPIAATKKARSLLWLARVSRRWCVASTRSFGMVVDRISGRNPNILCRIILQGVSTLRLKNNGCSDIKDITKIVRLMQGLASADIYSTSTNATEIAEFFDAISKNSKHLTSLKLRGKDFGTNNDQKLVELLTGLPQLTTFVFGEMGHMKRPHWALVECLASMTK